MSELIPPPISENHNQQDSTAKPKPYTVWTWIVFGSVILGLMGMQLTAYFAMPSEKESDKTVSAEVETGLKQYLATERILAWAKDMGKGAVAPGEAAVENPKTSETSLRQVESLIKSDGVNGLDEQRYLVVVQKALGETVDATALLDLRESEEQRDQLTADAVTGSAEAAEFFDSKSDDPAELLARGLALEAGGQENARSTVFPLESALKMIGGLLGFVALTGFGLIVLAGYWVMHGTGGLRPPKMLSMPAWTFERADASALRAGIYLFVYFVIAQGVVAGGLFALSKAQGVDLDLGILMITAQIVGVIFLVGISKLKIFGGFGDIRAMLKGEDSMFKMMGAGFLAYLANFPIFLGLTLISNFVLKGLPTPSHALAEELGKSSSGMTVFLLGISAAVFAPIIEEIVFRGWVFGGLLRRTQKVWLSIVITGLSFAVIHPQGPILYLALGAIGGMGAFLTYRTGSLIPAMTMHALHNATILMIGKTILG